MPTRIGKVITPQNYRYSACVAFLCFLACLANLWTFLRIDRFAGMGTGDLVLGMTLESVLFPFTSFLLWMWARPKKNTLIVALALVPAGHFILADTHDWAVTRSDSAIKLFERCFGTKPDDKICDLQQVEAIVGSNTLAFRFRSEASHTEKLLASSGFSAIIGDENDNFEISHFLEYAAVTPWSRELIYVKTLPERTKVVVLTDKTMRQCFVFETW